MRSYEGGQWDGDHLTFQTRNFGQFGVLSDTIGPTVKLVSKSPVQIRINVKDDLSGVAELAGRSRRQVAVAEI